MKRRSVSIIGIAALVAVIVFLTGCVTPQHRETSMTRQSGIRVQDVTFDTSFAREEYVILGEVSGEGVVERNLIGKEIPQKSYWFWKLPKSYYTYEYERSLGTWVDEEVVYMNVISDRKMDPFEAGILKRMETLAARVALYNALESMPEADAILAPRYEFEYRLDDTVLGQELIIARHVEAVSARIIGKGVRIKSDEELYETYARFPGLLERKREEGQELSFLSETTGAADETGR